ncbi:FKBP-type peptidyl-prolyl cis-trans isomerase [Sinimarinibacterium sp. NLF-5-8]|uniref:FKBP-type peptidyl-prolyl cis-trans isomerase n=1 Tax=Sinimarinibacterium sp. NLF-5-8 TaxID=2698684 RepID=UPI00137C17D8|nr:FKBP-type peptidyl-prolyl cis-trans isomerase [Sinimarinibacterium sp. NLF-5-8]
MFSMFRLTATAAAVLALSACTPPTAGSGSNEPVSLDNDAQKFSYAVGADIGASLKAVKEDVDMAALRAGLSDAFGEAELKLDEAAREEAKNTVSKKVQERQMAEHAKQADEALKAGETFLADNAKREGVKVTDSGLQYEVLTEGTGDKPSAADRVTVHYTGTLINGEVFDSSVERGQPVTFPLGNVIPGWTEGVQLMSPGAKYKFYIPAKLGYGERGAGGKIGPNQTLIFEVELISIEKSAD